MIFHIYVMANIYWSGLLFKREARLLSQLTKGDPNYTLVQVSVNDLIMIFAFTKTQILKISEQTSESC